MLKNAKLYKATLFENNHDRKTVADASVTLNANHTTVRVLFESLMPPIFHLGSVQATTATLCPEDHEEPKQHVDKICRAGCLTAETNYHLLKRHAMVTQIFHN